MWHCDQIYHEKPKQGHSKARQTIFTKKNLTSFGKVQIFSRHNYAYIMYTMHIITSKYTFL